jgi:hypothetical protein
MKCPKIIIDHPKNPIEAKPETFATTKIGRFYGAVSRNKRNTG